MVISESAPDNAHSKVLREEIMPFELEVAHHLQGQSVSRNTKYASAMASVTLAIRGCISHEGGDLEWIINNKQ